MSKKLKFEKFIEYLTREDLHTSLFERYLRLFSAAQYPDNMDGKGILDVGCGNGEFIFLLNIQNKISLGIDISQQKLRLAKESGNYKKLLKIDVCDAYKKVNQKFNIIISNSVLEHVKNLEKSLKSIFALLKQGGRFIFTVPRKGWESYLFHSKIKRSYGKEINTIFDHRNLLEENEWITTLQKQKFRIITCRPVPHFLENSLNLVKGVVE